jgi:hypothetical protein
MRGAIVRVKGETPWGGGILRVKRENRGSRENRERREIMKRIETE